MVEDEGDAISQHHDRVFTTTVIDGQLDLGSYAGVNNPLLNGIVVVRD